MRGEEEGCSEVDMIGQGKTENKIGLGKVGQREEKGEARCCSTQQGVKAEEGLKGYGDGYQRPQMSSRSDGPQ